MCMHTPSYTHTCYKLFDPLPTNCLISSHPVIWSLLRCSEGPREVPATQVTARVWLVMSTPLENMKVSWEYPNIWKKWKTGSKPPTSDVF